MSCMYGLFSNKSWDKECCKEVLLSELSEKSMEKTEKRNKNIVYTVYKFLFTLYTG